MNLNKNLLLATAIIGIGLFVLPSTLSMFAGQHAWYDPDPALGGIPCEKCHVKEEQELMGSSGPHSLYYSGLVNVSANYSGVAGANGTSTFWGGDDITNRCFGCHQVGANFTEDSGWESFNTNWSTKRNQSHAAVILQCIDCHPWVPSELTHGDEAHTAFYVSLNETDAVPANGTPLLKGANEACIGCHTYVGVNITWNRAAYVAFNATVNATSQSYDIEWDDSDDLGSNTSTTTNYSY